MSKQNESIIKFYLIAHKLKEKVRTGWMEVNISSDRLESVAEHIYGCLMLAIAIDSEYNLDLDMYKVLKMLALHELEETIMKDFTIRDGITREEKMRMGAECVKQATDGLIKQDEIRELLKEFDNRSSKEAMFCHYIDKVECDFQAKIYDLQGHFSMEEAISDIKYYDVDLDEMMKKIKKPSDIWLEYDKQIYKGDELFTNLQEDIRNIEKLD